MRVRPLGRVDDLLACRPRFSVRNIVRHRVVKQKRLLRHQPDLPPQRRKRPLPHIPSVNLHRPTRRIPWLQSSFRPN